MTAAAQHDPARICDQGYRPFQGEPGSWKQGFWVITRNELRRAWQEKWFRRLLVVSFAPVLVFAVMAIVRARLGALVPPTSQRIEDLWTGFYRTQHFFSLIVVYFVGQHAVGEDLRTGALLVYFARPLSFGQYLLGKWLAIACGILGVTLVPGLVLALIRWLAEPEAGLLILISWIGALVLSTALLSLTFGAVMLAISSLFQRGRAAGIAWVIAVVSLSSVSEGLSRASAMPELAALSFSQANQQLAGFLLQGKGSGAEASISAAAQLAWSALGFGVVVLRLRRWWRV